MSKKVIVTGGAGFIGSHTVVELDKAGFTPVIVDNFCNSEKEVIARLSKLTSKPPTLHEVDCLDSDAMARVFEQEGDVYGLIHFAAHKAVGTSVEKPLMFYQNNIGSLVSVLEVMQKFDVRRFVFSSSCTVYGQPDSLPVTEQSPQKPAESPYGRTKQFCEQIILDHIATGLPLGAVTLRYFNPIGAHESSLIGELPIGTPENLIPYITQTAAGIREKLTIFGDDYDTPDGTAIRDYIHVVDLANAHVKSLEWIDSQTKKSFNEVFNVGTGRGSSVLEAVRAFEAATGAKLNYEIGPRRTGDVVETYASTEKSKKILGWTPERDLQTAMKDAYNWQLSLAKRELSSS